MSSPNKKQEATWCGPGEASFVYSNILVLEFERFIEIFADSKKNSFNIGRLFCSKNIAFQTI